ncbi:CLUMA_CG010446, isoform A [Clunio marinus]|uniref:CLUMA_CG010446, isoform A n=1 Tax=Clunio marinus TaxID=568069 RepID=A0A1J1I9W9_9DIPT|nr:CLUMA_CG010446, isoform A [Clunio marinus]
MGDIKKVILIGVVIISLLVQFHQSEAFFLSNNMKGKGGHMNQQRHRSNSIGNPFTNIFQMKANFMKSMQRSMTNHFSNKGKMLMSLFGGFKKG